MRINKVILAYTLFLLTVAAQGQIKVTAPPTGAAIVSNGHFQNVFIYSPSTPSETWDQHLKAFLQNDIAANLTTNTARVAVDEDLEVRATSEAINAFVSTLTQSKYFSFAQQYGVESVTFDGGVFSLPACTSELGRGSPGYFALTDFVGCEFTRPFSSIS